MLRERGRTEEAEQLERGQLTALVASLRTPQDSDAAVQEKLNALFAVEADRVANAAVLAELLAPLLNDFVRSHAPSLAIATAPLVETPAATPPPSAPRPPKPERRPASIADFIDEMIAQESPPDRPPQRRAS